MRKILPLLLLIVLTTTISSRAVMAQQPAAKSRVTLTIDYGDGVQKQFSRIAWQAEMTVLDVLKAASRHRRGIRFKYRSSGSTAFLTQIDELTNQGRENNWIYRVNGQLGDRSFAIYELKAGDAILWRFGRYR